MHLLTLEVQKQLAKFRKVSVVQLKVVTTQMQGQCWEVEKHSKKFATNKGPPVLERILFKCEVMHYCCFLLFPLSLKSMFQNCATLRCSLWLFRSWGKSFFPVTAGSRSKTRPRRLRADFLERLKVRAKSMQNLLGHSAAWRGRSLPARPR